MSQIVELKVEEFHPLVGFDTSLKFEAQVGRATAELALALKEKFFLDPDVKVRYATHVFAKMLDELTELLEQPEFLN